MFDTTRWTKRSKLFLSLLFGQYDCIFLSRINVKYLVGLFKVAFAAYEGSSVMAVVSIQDLF